MAPSMPNEYFRSILLPDFPAVIPDPSDFTASILKALNQSTELEVAGSGSLMLWAPFHQLNPFIVVFGMDPTTGIYNPLTVLTYDETLSQNFIKGRSVSGRITVQSDTVTGNLFTVSGAATAISYQDLPPFRNPRAGQNLVSFSTLTSYGRNPVCKQPLTKIADGVTVLMHPEGQNRFWEITKEQNIAGNSDAATTQFNSYLVNTESELTSVSAYDTSAASGWIAQGTDITNGVNVFDSNNAIAVDGPWIPTNASGLIEVDVRLPFQVHGTTTVFGNYQVSIWAEVAYADPTTYAETALSVELASINGYANIDPATGSYQIVTSLHVVADLNATVPSKFGWIRRVYVAFVGQLPPIGAPTYQFEGTESSAFISVKWKSLAERWYLGPGAIIAVEGMSVGQVLGISGVLNLEVVPNSNLARNVPTNLTYIKDGNDLDAANHIVANSTVIALKFAYSNKEYCMLKEEFMALTTKGNANAMAASFKENIAMFWRKWLAPILRKVAPAIGGAFGPEGAAIGGFIGNLIPTYDEGGRQSGGLGANFVPGMGNPREPGMAMSRMKGFAGGGAPFWEADEGLKLKLITNILRGRRLPIQQLAMFLALNPSSLKFEQTRVPDITTELLEMSRKGLLEIISVTGSKFVSITSHLDPHTKVMKWASEQTSFTEEKFVTFLVNLGLSNVVAEDLFTRMLAIGAIENQSEELTKELLFSVTESGRKLIEEGKVKVIGRAQFEAPPQKRSNRLKAADVQKERPASEKALCTVCQKKKKFVKKVSFYPADICAKCLERVSVLPSKDNSNN